MEQTVDGAGLDPEALDGAVTRLLDLLDGIDADGWYATVEVVRPWSAHNPRITGEFARPAAIRRYLHRELTALLRRGAVVTVRRSRPALAFDDPEFFAAQSRRTVSGTGSRTRPSCVSPTSRCTRRRSCRRARRRSMRPASVSTCRSHCPA